MIKLRPGDRFEAEVYRIREVRTAPQHLRDTFRIVSLNIDIPGRVRTYFATVSWNIEKMGREPMLGDDVMVEYGPPHPSDREPRGRFHIVRLIGDCANRTMVGTVTWEPNNQAVYCRVQLNHEIGIPLAIKATFSGFDRTQLKKGVKVEVARSDQDDARRYHIIRILKAVEPKDRVVHFDIECHDADDFSSRCPVNVKGTEAGRWYGKDHPMNKNNDRVRFFIGYKYLQSSQIYGVLKSAFGIPEFEARELYRMQANGFWIICRPDQFARFMIYRNNAGLTNGFMDLKAELIYPKGDVYSRVAERAGVDRCAVKKVLLALNYDEASVSERLESKTAEIDVSYNS